MRDISIFPLILLYFQFHAFKQNHVRIFINILSRTRKSQGCNLIDQCVGAFISAPRHGSRRSSSLNKFSRRGGKNLEIS